VEARGQDGLVGHLLDGRYDVLARVARGGMATVYQAHDRRLDREVALKVMHPHLADDPTFVSRFVSEARSAARLSHPNVVQVFDQGADGDVLYLAMEFLAGRTLRDVITDRRVLTPREALSVFEPVLGALAAAHRAGIVHRDVKPENVVLTDDGRVKVADFGLARAVSGSATQTGSVIGTVAYLAPELVMHGTADARSDVYAAGIMLFEMLTGRQPFPGDLPMQIAYRHVHEDVPAPSTLVVELAPQLDELVGVATRRSPDERPDDAAAYLSLTQQVHADLTPDELDHRPSVPAPATPVATGAGFGRVPGTTQVLPAGPDGAAGPGHPDHAYADRIYRDPPAGGRAATGRGTASITQALPEVAALRTARARAGRDDVDAWSLAHADIVQLAERRKRRGTVLLVSVLAVAAVLGLLVWWWAGPGGYDTTPKLTNLTAAEATDSLTKKGLVASPQSGGEYSETVAKGRVARTDPADGQRVRKGGTVKFWLSLGTARRSVPTVKGSTLDQVRKLLSDKQLKLDEANIGSDYSIDVPEGRVISTNPAAGAAVTVGDTVAVVTSKGPKSVPLEDVRGKNVDEATQILKTAGFVVRTQPQNDQAPPGQVLWQEPQANQAQPQGSTITLTVSQGDMVTIPDLQGRPAREARRTLQDMGLTVRFNNVIGEIFGGTVQSTDPGAGASVPKGTTVTLNIG